MKILVLGSSGMLGAEIFCELKNKKYEIVAPARFELDILNSEKLERFLLGGKFDFVINCIAYTNVDKAEEERDLAYKINGEFVLNLSYFCKIHGVKLIHFSTDYVFPGDRKDGEYYEDDYARPLQAYGLTKLAGESHAVINEACVIRVQWLYGVFRDNYVSWMVKNALLKKQINVIAFQYGYPTWTRTIADAVVNYVIPKFNPGLYHFSNGEARLTKYEVARDIYNYFLGEIDLVKASMDVPLNWKAVRPVNICLNSDKFCVTFGYKRESAKNDLMRFLNGSASYFNSPSFYGQSRLLHGSLEGQ